MSHVSALSNESDIVRMPAKLGIARVDSDGGLRRESGEPSRGPAGNDGPFAPERVAEEMDS